MIVVQRRKFNLRLLIETAVTSLHVILRHTNLLMPSMELQSQIGEQPLEEFETCTMAPYTARLQSMEMVIGHDHGKGFASPY